MQTCIECKKPVCEHCGLTSEPSNLAEEHWPTLALGGPLFGKVPKGYCQTCGALKKKSVSAEQPTKR